MAWLGAAASALGSTAGSGALGGGLAAFLGSSPEALQNAATAFQSGNTLNGLSQLLQARNAIGFQNLLDGTLKGKEKYKQFNGMGQ
jgi:hypothetical protein